jgi:hypothetical protein
MTQTLTPAGLLKVVRDTPGCTLKFLLEAFDAPLWVRPTSRRPPRPDEVVASYGGIGDCLSALSFAGLVKITSSGGYTAGSPVVLVQGEPPSQDEDFITIAVSGTWQPVQDTLSISLTETAIKQAGNAMMVSPVFGPYEGRRNPKRSADLFVLMSFTAEMRSVYDEIRATGLACGLSVARADDFFGEGFIMQDIWTAICSARVVVADCSGRNANVFYELGLAHVVGTPAILIAQDVTDVPFDIRHRRVIPYRIDHMREFCISLEASIRAELAPRVEPGVGAQSINPRRP